VLDAQVGQFDIQSCSIDSAWCTSWSVWHSVLFNR